jgi:hypothetical protein
MYSEELAIEFQKTCKGYQFDSFCHSKKLTPLQKYEVLLALNEVENCKSLHPIEL